MEPERLIIKLGELYLLDDGTLRFVGRLADVVDGPGDTAILRMEIVWTPFVNLIRGTHVPCLPRWVIREAVPEDMPED